MNDNKKLWKAVKALCTESYIYIISDIPGMIWHIDLSILCKLTFPICVRNCFLLVSQRLVRLVLKFAFLCFLALNSLLFVYCLLFSISIVVGTVTFHVWLFVISFRSPSVLRHKTKTRVFRIQKVLWEKLL